MNTAIIGGGAAGFFLAINLKELMPQMEVTIFERSQHVLAKVAVSGGGRCNCTNTFRQVSDLAQVYPRGHRLLKRLFNVFDHRAAYAWFERHGVPLVTQPDECVFPAAQDSQAVIDCFLRLARQHHIRIRLGCRIQSLADVSGFDFVAVTTGGSPRAVGLQWLADAGHQLQPPVPSLFTLTIPDTRLRAMMGIVSEASVLLAGTKFRAEGPLLITHWGVSGPAILKLSSYAARYLAEHDYRATLSINWLRQTEALAALQRVAAGSDTRISPSRQLHTANPFGLTQRLWAALVERSLADRATIRWGELNRKDLNRLANQLTNDQYPVAGRAAFKEEFVTCGGIALTSVNPSTLESRHVPRLYFAGEVLDIDGITGGFNFQAAWTTAYVVSRSIQASSLANGS